jgi:hypothetical protein
MLSVAHQSMNLDAFAVDDGPGVAAPGCNETKATL